MYLNNGQKISWPLSTEQLSIHTDFNIYYGVSILPRKDKNVGRQFIINNDHNRSMRQKNYTRNAYNVHSQP